MISAKEGGKVPAVLMKAWHRYAKAVKKVGGVPPVPLPDIVKAAGAPAERGLSVTLSATPDGCLRGP